MNDVFKQSVDDFLAAASTDSPTPGGGSVAALTGALGAALVQMVGNLTVGKEKYRHVEQEMKQLVNRGSELMEKLKELAREDMAHFDTFMEVLSLPKNTPEEQAERAERIQQALKGATETPLAIAAAGVEVLALARRVADVGTENAVSDAAVAAHLAEAAVQAALVTADCNIPRIKDQTFVDRAGREKQRLGAEALQLKNKTVELVRSRMG
ncbi:formiminotetrahydrofolate cyclodeaminase [Desulfohalotomaculum tongense]|uniref:cyclodeaminase/cyclohydrolase family protein n=1 Tax=Desulforadius tongensis TaxID=1216062 RepID=UPI0019573062|nr:cyclodeaminase/cyclohydrolase family protein [Desulforadius tongensis]MBM7855495.1 formiminotetrahydrofolate cyclodeaminase [Desulforadius tongensis]